jgi:hypothetical protein
VFDFHTSTLAPSKTSWINSFFLVLGLCMHDVWMLSKTSTVYKLSPRMPLLNYCREKLKDMTRPLKQIADITCQQVYDHILRKYSSDSWPNHITPLSLRSNMTLSKIPTQLRIFSPEPQTNHRSKFYIVVHATVSVCKEYHSVNIE